MLYSGPPVTFDEHHNLAHVGHIAQLKRISETRPDLRSTSGLSIFMDSMMATVCFSVTSSPTATARRARPD